MNGSKYPVKMAVYEIVLCIYKFVHAAKQDGPVPRCLSFRPSTLIYPQTKVEIVGGKGYLQVRIITTVSFTSYDNNLQ